MIYCVVFFAYSITWTGQVISTHIGFQIKSLGFVLSETNQMFYVQTETMHFQISLRFPMIQLSNCFYSFVISMPGKKHFHFL